MGPVLGGGPARFRADAAPVAPARRRDLRAGSRPGPQAECARPWPGTLAGKPASPPAAGGTAPGQVRQAGRLGPGPGTDWLLLAQVGERTDRGERVHRECDGGRTISAHAAGPRARQAATGRTAPTVTTHTSALTRPAPGASGHGLRQISTSPPKAHGAAAVLPL
jgi:hypothetical protein